MYMYYHVIAHVCAYPLTTVYCPILIGNVLHLVFCCVSPRYPGKCAQKHDLRWQTELDPL